VGKEFMIKLKARINIIDFYTKLNNIRSNFGNTENSASIESVLNQKFAETAFVGTQISDENGYFPIPYEFILENHSLSGLVLNFDYLNNIYPTSVSLYSIKKVTDTVITTIFGETSLVPSDSQTGLEKKISFSSSHYTGDGLGFNLYNSLLSVFLKNVINNGEFTDVVSGYTISGTFVDFIRDNMYNIVNYDITKNNSDQIINIILTFSSSVNELPIMPYTVNISKSTSSTTTTTIKNLIGTYVDNDINYVINGISISSSETLMIEISQINKPYSYLAIYGISTDLHIDVDKHNIISIGYSHFDRDDIKSFSFGIISNRGTLEFKDTNNEVLNYAEDMLFKKGLSCNITLFNTLSKKETAIATVITSDWQYDNNDSTVIVSLKDVLEEWQDIQVEGFSYDPRNPKSVLPNNSMADLYLWLYERTPSKYNMLSFGKLDTETQGVLTNTIIDYPFLESDTLWRQWTKLCEVCGLHIYKDYNGHTVCTYNVRG
jgi:hypothetical protein